MIFFVSCVFSDLIGILRRLFYFKDKTGDVGLALGRSMIKILLNRLNMQ